jgi:hypothetical protein
MSRIRGLPSAGESVFHSNAGYGIISLMSEREEREDFERQMTIARKIMDERWVALRALALGDMYPDADVETLLEMASKQAAARQP